MTPEPVGLAEIAERLGVKAATAAMWNYRRLLPPPRWTVSRQPAWDWDDVETWAARTGRTQNIPATPTGQPGR